MFNSPLRGSGPIYLIATEIMLEDCKTNFHAIALLQEIVGKKSMRIVRRPCKHQFSCVVERVSGPLAAT